MCSPAAGGGQARSPGPAIHVSRSLGSHHPVRGGWPRRTGSPSSTWLRRPFRPTRPSRAANNFRPWCPIRVAPGCLHQIEGTEQTGEHSMRADRVAGLSTGERRRVADATDDKASSSNGSDANIIKLDSRTFLSRKESQSRHEPSREGIADAHPQLPTPQRRSLGVGRSGFHRRRLQRRQQRGPRAAAPLPAAQPEQPHHLTDSHPHRLGIRVHRGAARRVPRGSRPLGGLRTRGRTHLGGPQTQPQRRSSSSPATSTTRTSSRTGSSSTRRPR